MVFPKSLWRLLYWICCYFHLETSKNLTAFNWIWFTVISRIATRVMWQRCGLIMCWNEGWCTVCNRLHYREWVNCWIIVRGYKSVNYSVVKPYGCKKYRHEQMFSYANVNMRRQTITLIYYYILCKWTQLMNKKMFLPRCTFQKSLKYQPITVSVRGVLIRWIYSLTSSMSRNFCERSKPLGH